TTNWSSATMNPAADVNPRTQTPVSRLTTNPPLGVSTMQTSHAKGTNRDLERSFLQSRPAHPRGALPRQARPTGARRPPAAPRGPCHDPTAVPHAATDRLCPGGRPRGNVSTPGRRRTRPGVRQDPTKTPTGSQRRPGVVIAGRIYIDADR